MNAQIEEAKTTLVKKLSDGGIEGSVKFVMEGAGTLVYQDGNISETDEDTDVTLSASAEDFRDMFQGELDPTSAFMSGRLTIDGNMGLAMKLAQILS